MAAGFGEDGFGDWDFGVEPPYPVRPRNKTYLIRVISYLVLVPSLLLLPL